MSSPERISKLSKVMATTAAATAMFSGMLSWAHSLGAEGNRSDAKRIAAYEDRRHDAEQQRQLEQAQPVSITSNGVPIKDEVEVIAIDQLLLPSRDMNTLRQDAQSHEDQASIFRTLGVVSLFVSGGALLSGRRRPRRSQGTSPTTAPDSKPQDSRYLVTSRIDMPVVHGGDGALLQLYNEPDSPTSISIFDRKAASKDTAAHTTTVSFNVLVDADAHPPVPDPTHAHHWQTTYSRNPEVSLDRLMGAPYQPTLTDRLDTAARGLGHKAAATLSSYRTALAAQPEMVSGAAVHGDPFATPSTQAADSLIIT